MGNKRIDLGRSVYALCSEYPELLELMKDMGFKDIVMPGMDGPEVAKIARTIHDGLPDLIRTVRSAGYALDSDASLKMAS